MKHFPALLDLRGRCCLVIGSGYEALNQVHRLVEVDARIRLFCPNPMIGELSEVLDMADGIEYRDWREAVDTEDIWLVILATEDRELCTEVAAECRHRRIWCNSVDDLANSSFITPARVERWPLQVLVSSGGVAPVLARRVRAKVEALLPTNYGALAGLIGRLRPRVQAQLTDSGARRRFWDQLLDGSFTDRALAGDETGALAAFEAELAHPGAPGLVTLVGAGPGDPDLLTLAGLDALQRADVILYDRLVPAGVLDRARRDAECIPVWKKPGGHNLPREQIIALMVERAGRGERVVRLKGGDPLVFGRGGEELSGLAEAGVGVRVIPGITAATGVSAALGIPLTDRHGAQALVLVTGHVREGGDAPNWAALAASGATLAIYMGLHKLPAISEHLQQGGMPPKTPVVVVERGTTDAERRLHSTLREVAGAVAAAGLEPPAMVIIGSVLAGDGV